MPDLHRDAVNAFWDTYDRRTLYRIIASLERKEYWALDEDPDLDEAVMELGQALDMAMDPNFTGSEVKLVRILANMKSGRAMRILQSLEMVKPGTASNLLSYADKISADIGTQIGNRQAKVFLRRNLVFERLQLISRVFAPQRIATVIKGLEMWEASS